MDCTKSCDKCSADLVVLRGQYTIYSYCPKCFEEKYISKKDGQCCFSPEILPVKVLMQGGGFQIRQQCNNCGYSFGLALKKSDFDLSKIELRNDNKPKEFYEKAAEEHVDFKAKFEEFKEKNYSFENKFPGYTLYLNSDQWKKKRQLVLQRDNNYCQSCLANKAVQVHHLTYKHVFNEPLFDLIAVCNRCHDIITNMDRQKETDKI